MTSVVTTFSKDGYDLYGHKMISSWIKYWPKDFNLLVYTEGYNIDEKDERITILDIDNACPSLKTFKEKSLDMINHYPKDKRWRRRIEKTIKWSHKVYVISHALSNLKNDYLIYLDGDTWTRDFISKDIASQLIKNHFIGVHFENISLGLHFETGLIIFNKHHKQMNLFKKIFQAGYDDLEIYQLEKTWDTFWLMHLWKKYNLDILDLAIDKRSSVFGNPLIYNKILHDVGTKKYLQAGYNKFTGKK